MYVFGWPKASGIWVQTFLGMGWGRGPKQAQETQTLKQGQKEKAPPLNRDDKNSNDPNEWKRERKVHEQNCTLDNTIDETSSVWTNLI
jgi:hypothetical protein